MSWRRSACSGCGLATAIACGLVAYAGVANAARVRWIEDQLVVRAHRTAQSTAPAQLVGEGVWTAAEIPGLDVVVINTPPGRAVAVARDLRDSNQFRFVERNYV